jgi:hypothetical protein
MDCPVCSNTLKEVFLELPSSDQWDSMRVDVCEGGCGGMFFERFELEKVDEQDEQEGTKLLDITSHAGNVEIDHDLDRDCPQCDGVTMMDRFFSVSRNVEVDECGGCGGIWLDAGELEDIRQLYEDEEAKEEAFDEYFENEFAPELQEKAMERSEPPGFIKALRFICPSFYIPGDQAGGAY